MLVVNVGEAKKRLSELVRLVESGEKIVLARNGTPVAELVAVAPQKRQGGIWKGRAWILSRLRRAAARGRARVLRRVRLHPDMRIAV